MKYTEKQLRRMASPISQSEDEKCKNAIRMVRDAMKNLNYTDDGKEIRSYVADTYSYVLKNQMIKRKINRNLRAPYPRKCRNL